MSLDVTLYMDVDVGRDDKERVEFFTANITHNLTEMAVEAGIYKHVWRPEEVYYLTAPFACLLVAPLSDAINKMHDYPEHFKKFNPENGWGDYDGFVKWIERYHDACLEYPHARIDVWR